MYLLSSWPLPFKNAILRRLGKMSLLKPSAKAYSKCCTELFTSSCCEAPILFFTKGILTVSSPKLTNAQGKNTLVLVLPLSFTLICIGVKPRAFKLSIFLSRVARSSMGFINSNLTLLFSAENSSSSWSVSVLRRLNSEGKSSPSKNTSTIIGVFMAFTISVVAVLKV